jgi:AcrR family transcriptional regulator
VPRETLTQDQIVRTAIELLDNEGIEGLSMRQLGTRLNSAATAVYWHVKSKDNLLVLAADAVWEEIDLPDLEKVTWQVAATAMAKGLFAMILRHPWLVPAMSTHLLYGPGKARHDDHLLAVYQAAGFTGRDAGQAMKTVFTFVLGNALGVASEAAWRARLRRTGGDEQEQIRHLVAQATEIAMRFPRLRAHSTAQEDDVPSPVPGHELEFGLRTILNGLQAELGTRPA